MRADGWYDTNPILVCFFANGNLKKTKCSRARGDSRTLYAISRVLVLLQTAKNKKTAV